MQNNTPALAFKEGFCTYAISTCTKISCNDTHSLFDQSALHANYGIDNDISYLRFPSTVQVFQKNSSLDRNEVRIWSVFDMCSSNHGYVKYSLQTVKLIVYDPINTFSVLSGNFQVFV